MRALLYRWCLPLGGLLLAACYGANASKQHDDSPAATASNDARDASPASSSNGDRQGASGEPGSPAGGASGNAASGSAPREDPSGGGGTSGNAASGGAGGDDDGSDGPGTVTRQDPETDPEAAADDASTADASPPEPVDFTEACERHELTRAPECFDCVDTVHADSCATESAAFSRECAPAENCYARNCGRLCGRQPCDERCACAETCLPEGESRCRALWAALYECIAGTCLDDCASR